MSFEPGSNVISASELSRENRLWCNLFANILTKTWIHSGDSFI
jgi:hypothetical protein